MSDKESTEEPTSHQQPQPLEQTVMNVNKNCEKNSIREEKPAENTLEHNTEESKVSDNTEGKLVNEPSSITDAKSTREEKDKEKQEEKDKFDKDAIDRYYENNQYTVTGHYQKNQDTFSKVPSNYMKVLRENGPRRRKDSREPSQSVYSRKTNASLPIPGANRNRFVSSFYWLAQHHRKIGFRHFTFILMVVFCNLIGAVIFYNIESNAEHNIMNENIGRLEERISETAKDVKSFVESKKIDFKNDRKALADYIRNTYIRMLKSEGRWKYSSYYKAIDDDHMQWSFGSAYFLCSNVYTTVGYGAIAPAVTISRCFVMLYGFIFAPLTLVVIRDLGQCMLIWLTKVYARLLIRWRTANGYQTKEDKQIILPIKISLALLIVYFLSLSVFVWVYDQFVGEPGTGTTFFRAMYFSFITVSKVGLGDVMPDNATYSPVIAIITFLGMPILMTINRASFIAVENGIFGTMTVIENKLEGSKLGNVVKPVDLQSETGVVPSIRPRSITSRSKDAASLCEEEKANEFLNNFTVRSIATFMKSRSDVYGGDFGRVTVNKSEVKEN